MMYPKDLNKIYLLHAKPEILQHITHTENSTKATQNLPETWVYVKNE